jgi:hypothetical protein
MLYLLLSYYTLNDYDLHFFFLTCDLHFCYCIDNYVTQFLKVSSLLYNYNVYNQCLIMLNSNIWWNISSLWTTFFIFSSITWYILCMYVHRPIYFNIQKYFDRDLLHVQLNNHVCWVRSLCWYRKYLDIDFYHVQPNKYLNFVLCLWQYLKTHW